MKRLALALLLWAGVVSAAPGFPHVACYSATAGGGSLILNDDLNQNPGVERALAKFQLITMNLTPWFDFRPGVLDTIRSYHRGPEKLVILAYDQYGVRFSYATAGAIWTDLWNLVNDGGTGLLYGTDGVIFFNSLNQWVNLSRSELTRAQDSIWINRVINTGKCDGIFFDTTTGAMDDLGSGTGFTNDFARAGYASAAARDTLRCRNMVTATSRMRSAKQSLIVVSNGSLHDTTDNRATWDGNMNEGFPTQFISPAANTLNQHMHNGPYAWAATYSATLNGHAANSGAEYNAANTKQMRFGLGCACLSGGYASFTANRDLPAFPGASYLEWWYDEYSVNRFTGIADTSGAHTGWMGGPLGPPVYSASTGVWTRQFEHGMVIVNPTATAVQVPLGATNRLWRHITGVRETTINNGKDDGSPVVPNLDALFLVPVDQR